MVWHLLTGEYPPQTGGVGDHALFVARGLAESGDQVNVWAPQCEGPEPPVDPRIHVHRLPGQFGAKALCRLSHAIGSDGEILVEYVPHAFGFKSMNLALCLWLFSRRHTPITVLFHEVSYALTLRQPMKYNAVGLVHRVMAWLVARSASRIFVTIPGWVERLKPLVGEARSGEIRVLTTHNLIPVIDDPTAVARLHRRYAPNGLLLGHFGTYASSVTPMLEQSVPSLLRAHPEASVLLLGKGGESFSAKLSGTHRDLKGCVFAPGVLGPEDLSRHLSACDLLLQPYPDGVSGRRSSLMAGLAHGRPIVTTAGTLSEPFWIESGAVRAVPAGDPRAFVGMVEELIARPAARLQLGAAAARLYAERFDLSRTIEALRSGSLAERAPERPQACDPGASSIAASHSSPH